ncbi:LOW QUALITY PROTEIN: hypothetical protein V2J09_007388 [Rumex salicifolius]
MYARQALFLMRRSLHTASHHRPSEALRKKIAEIERLKKTRNPKKNELFYENHSHFSTQPPCLCYLLWRCPFRKAPDDGTVDLPISSSTTNFQILNTWFLNSWLKGSERNEFAVHFYDNVLFGGQYDDSRSQELIERKIRNAPPDQGTVRMLTREEWDEIREVRPRTPFESKLARPHARIRTGEPIHKDDLKDWTIDVIMDAFTRVEESIPTLQADPYLLNPNELTSMIHDAELVCLH